MSCVRSGRSSIAADMSDLGKRGIDVTVDNPEAYTKPSDDRGRPGIWPLDQSATVASLRAHGMKVEILEPAAPNRITNVMDPNGVRLELVDFLPESLQRKAIDSWK